MSMNLIKSDIFEALEELNAKAGTEMIIFVPEEKSFIACQLIDDYVDYEIFTCESAEVVLGDGGQMDIDVDAEPYDDIRFFAKQIVAFAYDDKHVKFIPLYTV